MGPAARSVGEVVAVIALIAVAIVAAVVFGSVVQGVLARSSSSNTVLKVYASNIEKIQVGTTFSSGDPAYGFYCGTIAYLFVVDMVVANLGDTDVRNLNWREVPYTNSPPWPSTCPPIALSSRLSNVPTSVPAGGTVSFKLYVASTSIDLQAGAANGLTYFAIEASGVTADGRPVKASLDPFRGR